MVAPDEIDAYLDAARRRIDAFAEGRLRRIAAVADELTARCEELAAHLGSAWRSQADVDALVQALAIAADEVSAEANRAPITIPPPTAGPAAMAPRGSATAPPARSPVVSTDEVRRAAAHLPRPVTRRP